MAAASPPVVTTTMSAWNRLQVRLFHYDAFISYAQADGLGYAMALENRLGALGYTVFRDAREMPVGTTLAKHITRGLKRSRMLIVLDTTRARGSEWVTKEIADYLTLHAKKPRTMFAIRHVRAPPPWAALADRVFVDEEDGRLEPPQPSDEVIRRIEAQRTFRLARTWARWLLVAFVSALVVSLGAFVVQYLATVAAKDEALAAANQRARSEAATALAAARTQLSSTDPSQVALAAVTAAQGIAVAPSDDPMLAGYLAWLAHALEKMPDRAFDLGGRVENIAAPLVAVSERGRYVVTETVLGNTRTEEGTSLWDLDGAASTPLFRMPSTELDVAFHDTTALLSENERGVLLDLRRGEGRILEARGPSARLVMTGSGRLAELTLDHGMTLAPLWPEADDGVGSYAWSPRLMSDVVFGRDRDFVVWSAEQNASDSVVLVTDLWRAPAETVLSLAVVDDLQLSPDGRYVAAVGRNNVDDRLAYVIDTATARIVNRLELDESELIVGNGGTLCICSMSAPCGCIDPDGTIRLLDGVELMALSSDGRVHVGDDCYVPLATSRAHRHHPDVRGDADFALSPDHHTIVALGDDGMLMRWRARPSPRTAVPELVLGSIEAAHFKPGCADLDVWLREGTSLDQRRLSPDGRVRVHEKPMTHTSTPPPLAYAGGARSGLRQAWFPDGAPLIVVNDGYHLVTGDERAPSLLLSFGHGDRGTIALEFVNEVLPQATSYSAQDDQRLVLRFADGMRLDLTTDGALTIDGLPLMLAEPLARDRSIVAASTRGWYAAREEASAGPYQVYDARSGLRISDDSGYEGLAVCALPDGATLRVLHYDGTIHDHWVYPAAGSAHPRPWLVDLGGAVAARELVDGVARTIDPARAYVIRTRFLANLEAAARGHDDVAKRILEVWGRRAAAPAE